MKIKNIFPIAIYVCIVLNLVACGLIVVVTDDEDIKEFNQDYAPSYKIIDKNLYVDWDGVVIEHNWRGDIVGRKEAPLKLKIPLSYLQDVLSENGTIGYLGRALDPMSVGHNYNPESKIKDDPNNKKLIATINFQITKNGEPAINYFRSILHSEERSNKISEYESSLFRFSLSDRYSDPIEKEDYFSFPGIGTEKDFVRGKDIAGLETYMIPECFDIKKLKDEFKADPHNYYKDEKLYRLAHKSDDEKDMPENCIADLRSRFWITPSTTPKEDMVAIECRLIGCNIRFLYKKHYVNILTPMRSGDVAANWKNYRNVVIMLLERFEKEAENS